ncbi:hypothetical protein LTR56_000108 [Elasticomyces elasticus]|nr:hypothetical protein LTR56_000108 [Elasticomyces elasticus]KAK3667096.1 hypothetical protein LTR22_001960 [Elasticomyces elasticus]KAK4932871.1 hypothetical protein LTR49_000827 [Elasticomyces elasticus]KAK5768725.1 hypothetical protein LTS12_001151 [Elasticomyces elasticus]
MADKVKESSEPEVKSPFPLLELPAEIWSQIARSAVTSDEPIRLCSYGCPKSLQHRTQGTPPAITQVCKIIREEILSTFYLANTFTSYDYGDRPADKRLVRWLRAYSQAYTHRAMDVFVESHHSDAQEFFDQQLGKIGFAVSNENPGETKRLKTFRVVRVA